MVVDCSTQAVAGLRWPGRVVIPSWASAIGERIQTVLPIAITSQTKVGE